MHSNLFSETEPIFNTYLNNPNSFEISFGFNRVAIQQKKNICKSRLDVDTKSEIMRGVFVDIPIWAANMLNVVDADFLIKIMKLGGFGALHRAQSEENYIKEVAKVALNNKLVPFSIGVGESQFALAMRLILVGGNVCVIDVAHGYSDEVINFGRKLKKEFNHIKIVVGNTVNIQMMREVDDFADALKVGLGQGQSCTTKNVAGATEGQFTAVYKFKEMSKRLGLPIISDGAIREPADLNKAIGAGANSVMAGSIFCACVDSPAPVVEINGESKKIYAGMASEYTQNKWKGGLKPGTSAEGTVKYLDVGPTVEKLMEIYLGGLRSGITYAGGNDIPSFQKNVEFIRII